MGKSHLKRLAALKTWNVKRKGAKFITKSAPGPHSLATGVPFCVLLKETLGYAESTRDAKKVININEIMIDGKARKDERIPVGIFDTIGFASINEYFRVILNDKGKIGMVKIKKEEAMLKPCKIIGKNLIGGRRQLNLYDGKNIYVDDGDYKVGDTVVLTLPEHKISKHLKMDKKSAIFLTGGKHIGEIGVVENIIRDKIVYKDSNGELIETLKEYAFVVGQNKPMITLEDEQDEKHKG